MIIRVSEEENWGYLKEKILSCKRKGRAFGVQTTVSDCDEAFQEIRRRRREGGPEFLYLGGEACKDPAEFRDA